MNDCGCTVQGLPLNDYLKKHPVYLNIGSTADGRPVKKQYYVRKAPIKTDKAVNNNAIQTSHDVEAIHVLTYKPRRHGKPPVKKPRYKDICRETSRRQA